MLKLFRVQKVLAMLIPPNFQKTENHLGQPLRIYSTAATLKSDLTILDNISALIIHGSEITEGFLLFPNQANSEMLILTMPRAKK